MVAAGLLAVMITGLAVAASMVAARLLAVVAAVASFWFAVVAVMATITAFPGFLNALPPCFFGALHPLADFGALLFAHVVPTLPQCRRVPFSLGGSTGVSFRFAAVVTLRSLV